MIRFMKLGLMLLFCLATTACAYTKESNMREEFQSSMKNYNRMLRWHELESAGMLYLEPELREAFMQSAEAIRRKGITITDYRILTSECTPEKSSAEVVAEFDYYAMPSNRIKTVTYYQHWAHSEINDVKTWKLKSGLPAFE